MTSRLDRLFLLLETGTTPLTRRAAALQLGEVQKLHPHELNNLLVKVRQYLHSTSWDTRIAASQAVEAIVANVPLWYPAGVKQPNEPIKCESTDNGGGGYDGRMTFDHYDMNVVIKSGLNLMASEGKEYEDIEVNTTFNPVDERKKIAEQRLLLNKKLGVNIDLELEFISNQDLQLYTPGDLKPETSETTKLSEIIPKHCKRRSSSVQMKTIKLENDCDAGSSSKRVKIETDSSESSNSDMTGVVGGEISDDWPLEWFGDELMADLFNAHWVVRHGAATGLREIVKLQGRCGGRARNAITGDMDKLNQKWLEDLSLRLLSVLALDRFGDFLTDQVVAPVRETCAQVLGLVIQILHMDNVNNVVRILLQLLECKEWEARHGGMLGMKYLLAIRKDMVNQLLPQVFDPIFNGLKDNADDVSAVAAAALVPVKDALMSRMPEKVPLVIEFLWNALLVLDDLSSSTGDLLMLLSSLLTFKGSKCVQIKQEPGQNEDEVNGVNDKYLDYDDQQLGALITRLWPFLSHTLSSVRKSVLDSLIILCEKSSNSWITSSLLSDALRLLYQRSMIESKPPIFEHLVKVWICLLSKAKYSTLIEASCNYLAGWLCLMMQPSKIAIEPANTPVWLDFNLVSKHRSTVRTQDDHSESPTPDPSTISEQYYIGGSEWLGEANEVRERSVVRARCQCAKLLGLLAYYLAEPEHNDAEDAIINSVLATPQTIIESIATLFLFHLNTKSANQRMCTAWLIKEWAMVERGNGGALRELYHPIADRCLKALSELIYYEELSTQYGRIQVNVREFISYLRVNSIQFEESKYPTVGAFSLQSIQELVHEVETKSLPALRQEASTNKRGITKKMKLLIEALEEKAALLRKNLIDLTTNTNSYQITVNSAIASALVMWSFLPERLNPVVRPLMDSIKSEANEQLQSVSAISLTKLLQLCCDRVKQDPTQPSPISKIIKNLIIYLCSDRNFTPIVNLENLSIDEITQKSVQFGIITLNNIHKAVDSRLNSFRRSNSISNSSQQQSQQSNSHHHQQQQPSVSQNGSSSTNGNGILLLGLEQQQQQNEIQRRGAMQALCKVCSHFGIDLPENLPTLWDNIRELSNVDPNANKLPTLDESGLSDAQLVVQRLQVLEVIGPYIDSRLHSTLIGTFDYLSNCLQSSYRSIRHLASRCFGMLAATLPNETMNIILCQVLDALESQDNVVKRQGSVEAVSCVIERLQLNIVPYIVFLIVPMLGRMSDQDESVRVLATQCFAQLIQLMPLDVDQHHSIAKPTTIEHSSSSLPQAAANNATSDSDSRVEIRPVNGCSKTSIKEMLSSTRVNFSPELMKRKEDERHFLEQLVDIKKLDNYKLPIPVKAELRTYQQDGLNWLAFLNKYKLHGIIADEMGLGKTLQAICILASDYHYHRQRFLSGESQNRPQPSIVICPPTLIGHWQYEVSKFVDSEHLSPIMYSGPPQIRAMLKAEIQKSMKISADQDQRLDSSSSTSSRSRLRARPSRVSVRPPVHNLVIASYDLVRNDIEFFSSITWNYCILDEGHVIKNGKTKIAKAIKSLPASHRLILTGTPIQNNVLELWSLFDFLMPGFLGSERQFMARYSRPILVSRDAKSSSKEQEAGVLAMEALHRQVLPFILRRMKEDVLKDLPPKIIQDYYCELSSLQMQLYDDFAKSRARQSLEEAIGTVDGKEAEKTIVANASSSHIFQSLQYLRKVCNHPKLVLSPSHPHYEGILRKLKSDNSTLSDISHAAKLCALKQLLLDCGIGLQSGSTATDEAGPVVNQHRALVFCQLKAMLDIVEKDLLKAHMPSVTYLRLDGNIPPNERYSVVHTFNNDPSIDVLLLTTQVGGLGLNLTGADTVIFVEHDWNPMKDLQAMDRAHRIGQKKVVNVYRLITTGTLEEKIMGLQKFKLTVANTVISSENSNLNSMGTDQLLDLFEYSSSAGDKNDASSSSMAAMGASASGSSMKTILDNLPELWDAQQYENEYNLNTFLHSLSDS